MKFIAFTGVVACLLVLAFFPAASAAPLVTIGLVIEDPDIRQAQGQPATRTVTLRMTNHELDAQATTVELTATSPAVTFVPSSSSIELNPKSSHVLTFTMSIGTTGPTGILDVHAYVNMTNSTGTETREERTASFSLSRVSELALTILPPYKANIGAGGSHTFEIFGHDPWGGWRSTSVNVPSTLTCAGADGSWSSSVTRHASFLNGNTPVKLATVTIYPPGNLRPDDLSPGGRVWRETTVVCSLAISHTADVPASPVSANLRLNPFFGGRLVAPDSGTVKATRDEGTLVDLEVQYRNRIPEEVSVTVTPNPSEYVSFPSAARGMIVQFDALDRLRVPTLLDASAPPGLRSVTVDVVVRNSTGVLIESSTVQADLVVTRPVELLLDASTETPPFGPGESAALAILGSERYKWSDVTLFPAASSVSCPPELANWSPRLAFTNTSVPAGARPFPVARVHLDVPSDLNVKAWRHRNTSCSVSIGSNAGNGLSTSSSNLVLSVDPIIPSALSFEFSPGQIDYEFLTPRSESPTFEATVSAQVRNWGEVEWRGAIQVVFAEGACEATWTSTGQPVLPANPASTPASTTLPGRLTVTYQHAEGSCPGSNATSGNVHVLASLGPPYRIVYGAKLSIEDAVDFGNVSIGDSVSRSIGLRELLGYVDVPLGIRAALSPESTSLARGILPELPAHPVAGSQGGSVDVVYRPPAALPPCGISWDLTWSPIEQRPGLERVYHTRATAQSTLTGVESSLDTLASMRVSGENTVQALLNRLIADGCKLSENERHAAQRALAALHALDSVVQAMESEPQTPSTLLRAASHLNDVQASLGVGQADRHPALEALDEAHQQMQSRMRIAVLAAANGEVDGGRSVEALTDLALTLDRLELDSSEIRIEREDVIARTRAKNEEAREATDRLFQVPSRVPLGIEIVKGLSINPNPFGWIALRSVESQMMADRALAEAAFEGKGPLAERVGAAQLEAQASVAISERALYMGAMVDAMFAVGLAFLGSRMTVKYARDVEEVTLGKEFGY